MLVCWRQSIEPESEMSSSLLVCLFACPFGCPFGWQLNVACWGGQNNRAALAIFCWARRPDGNSARRVS